MDTIVVATGMPLCLAFLGQDVDDVVRLWESWVQSGELVRARHDDPARDAAIRLRPASMGCVEFIPNEPGVRSFPDRMLWSLPSLVALGGSDLAPQQSHYSTLAMTGMTARPETLTDGRTGLVLGAWEFGRL